ncbi:hypothetical protein CPC08DRAFT_794965 [Agrocybe pediades]|nr:hypothetical protein CPC08DRAFT_794965 [Agrocybe pediades]
MTSDIRQEKAQCHCKTTSVVVSFLTANLPIEHTLCHCNTCRHVEGQMAFYFLPIEGPPLFGGALFNAIAYKHGDVTSYRTSPNSVRYFCHNCSATVLRCDNETDWFVSGGSLCLDNKDEIARLAYHINVADTLDGGMSNHIPSVDGKKLPRYAQCKGSDELPMNWRSENLKSVEDAKKDTRLSGYCHCGNIQFEISRPNFLSATPHAPYPDLLYPRAQTRLSTVRNSGDEKWWLYPPVVHSVTRGTKYVAGYCLCDICRQSGGFEAQAWVWIPRSNLFERGSSKHIDFVDGPKRPKHLKQYLSSPGRFREFCDTCGATAFWWTTSRSDIIDISIGLLDQNVDGVRAEEWLKWYQDRLSFIETAHEDQKSIVRGLKSGLRVYKEMKHEETPGAQGAQIN